MAEAMPVPGSLTRAAAPEAAAAAAARWRAARPALFERIYLALILSVIIATPFLVHDQTEGRPLASLNPLRFLEHQSTAGNSHKQVLLASLYASCVIVLLLRNRFGALRLLGIPLAGVMLWTVASVAWSVDPSLTLRRCAAIDGIALVGAYAGLRFRFAELLRVMAWVTAIVLVASIAVAVLLPADGLDYDGRLRGVLDHKNDLGGFAALSLLMVTSRLLLSPALGRLQILVECGLAALAITCLFLAHSATPVSVLIVSMLTLFATRLARNGHRTMLALAPLLVSVSVIALGFLAFQVSEVVPLFGRNADLSGRTLIWRFALQMVWARPLGGYGYGAFWAGANSPGSVFWYLTHVAATHAHNGYLQLTLDDGIVGLSLMVSAIGLAFYRLGWLLRNVREPFVPWAFAHLAFICATNMTESTMWGVGNSLQTALLVYAIVRTNLLVGGASELIARMPAALLPVAAPGAPASPGPVFPTIPNEGRIPLPAAPGLAAAVSSGSPVR